MDKVTTRRRSIVWPLILIGLGALFLYGSFRPEASPWTLVSRWWPLLLIFLGLGKLWDHWRASRHPEAAGAAALTGGEIAILVLLLLLLGVSLTHTSGGRRDIHEFQSVDRQGAESVRAHIEMGAGELKVAGGARKLLEVEFDYSAAEGKPQIGYEVSGKEGELSVTQTGGGVHLGRTRNDWDLRFENDVPLELKVDMGAGQGQLLLGGLSLTKLDIEMGAGQAAIDLTGDWKRDLDASVHGGVGTATIRFPRNVGVQVHASGGIGSINAHGLKREGDVYVNDEYGKSPVTLRVNVEGGVGTINLEQGP